MKKNKLLAILLISIGLWILFYRRSGFYGWGGYVDNSIVNIISSSILISVGFLILKRVK